MKGSIKEAVNDSLTYFASNCARETGKRGELAYRAGTLITRVIDELCDNDVIKKSVDPESRAKYIECRYEMSKAALHNRDHEKLDRMLRADARKNLRQSLKLAEGIDSCYSEANEILMNILKDEAVFGESSEDMDCGYFSEMMYNLNMGFLGSVDMICVAWTSDIGNNVQAYAQIDSAASKSLEEYTTRIGDKMLEKNALMMAGKKLYADKKKVTKDELDSLVKECRGQLEKISNQLSQLLPQGLGMQQTWEKHDAPHELYA